MGLLQGAGQGKGWKLTPRNTNRELVARVNKSKIVVVMPEDIRDQDSDCLGFGERIKSKARFGTNRVDGAVWMIDHFKLLLEGISFVVVPLQHLHIFIPNQQAVVSVKFDIVLGEASKISDSQKAVVVPNETNVEGVHLFGLVVVVQPVCSIVEDKFRQIGGKIATSAVEYFRQLR